MKAFRIADSRHSIFDGTGAFLSGGRWNSRGHRVIYCAETYAGALLEQLAHANLSYLPGTQKFVEIEIPEPVAVERVSADQVPGWDFPDFVASRRYGDGWLREGRTAVLVVPSAVTFGLENNVLINELHRDFSRIQASEPMPVKWDPRFFARSRKS